MSGHSKGHNIVPQILTVSRALKNINLSLAQFERNQIHKNQ